MRTSLFSTEANLSYHEPQTKAFEQNEQFGMKHLNIYSGSIANQSPS